MGGGGGVGGVGGGHTFENNIVLTKMTPFNVQFGVKRPLNIQRIYSFGPWNIQFYLFKLCKTMTQLNVQGLWAEKIVLAKFQEKRLRNQRKHALLASKT